MFHGGYLLRACLTPRLPQGHRHGARGEHDALLASRVRTRYVLVESFQDVCDGWTGGWMSEGWTCVFTENLFHCSHVYGMDIYINHVPQLPPRLFSLFIFFRIGHLVLVESDGGIALDEIEIDLVAEQVTDIAYGVLDHGRTLKGETETVDAEVTGQAHGFEHLWSEHARVANLDPLTETVVVAKDFHGGLGVGVIGGLEAKV